MNKRIGLLCMGLILLALFYFFSREVKRGFLKNTDFNVTVKIQDKLSSKLRLDGWLEDAGILASPIVTSVAVILFTGWGILTAKDWKNKISFLIIPFLFIGIVAGEIYGKSVVNHPAPPFFMIKHPTTIFPTYYINESYSYPSGHAARAVFLGIVAVSIARQAFGKKSKAAMILGLGAVCYVAVIALSRIYLGHHWLSDILGGLILGSGMGSFVLWL